LFSFFTDSLKNVIVPVPEVLTTLGRLRLIERVVPRYLRFFGSGGSV